MSPTSLLTLLLIPAAAFLPSTRLPPHARCELHQQRSVLLAQAELPVATLEADAAGAPPAPLAQQPPASAPPASAPPPAAPDAVASTLSLLEWDRLSDQVASFAATGRARSPLPFTRVLPGPRLDHRRRPRSPTQNVV